MTPHYISIEKESVILLKKYSKLYNTLNGMYNPYNKVPYYICKKSRIPVIWDS